MKTTSNKSTPQEESKRNKAFEEVVVALDKYAKLTANTGSYGAITTPGHLTVVTREKILGLPDLTIIAFGGVITNLPFEVLIRLAMAKTQEITLREAQKTNN